MISGGFKSNNFLSAHSKRLADAFFVTANSKGLADLDQRQSIAPPKGHEPRAEGVLSLACSCPIARSSRFFWRGCQDQSISVGLILDLPPGTSVVPLVSRDQTTLVGWNHNNLVILKCAATAAGLPSNQPLLGGNGAPA